ncbi:MAG: hypothetical protein WKG00_08300 [Polyangiaceae bacterium]
MDAAALRPFARRFRAACLLGAALACGCATPAGGVGGGAHDAAPPVAGVRLRSTPAASSAAGAAGEAPEVVEAPPPIGDAEAVTIVDPEGKHAEALLAACPAGSADRVACLVSQPLARDEAAVITARAMLASSGHVVGLERAHVMEGGFRGRLQLVPEPPIGAHRKHLEWVAAATHDLDRFFGVLVRPGGPGTPPGALRYRWRALAFRFFRSVGRTTPSAYAEGWTVAYNVSGSLHTSADAVRETLFHEIFHLNDAAHQDWSRRALGPIYDAIVTRCVPGARRGAAVTPPTACVAPFAPNDTKLKVGGYYAFHADGGVPEYAAELAIRYYREQRRALGVVSENEPSWSGSFKCGPPENARAWKLMADEFFGGVDHTRDCPSAP